MNYIASNEKLILHLAATGSVRDFTVYQFKVFENGQQELVADVYLRVMQKGLPNRVKVRFMNIKEYLFHYHSPDFLYHIKTFSFSPEKDLFHFSFDTVDAAIEPDHQKGNFIFAQAIEGFAYPKEW